MNLGEEYLPSKFFSMPQTGEDFHNLSQYKNSCSGQNDQIEIEVFLGRTAFYIAINEQTNAGKGKRQLELHFCLDGIL